jgi:RNase P protein component
MSVKIFYKDGKNKDFVQDECLVDQLSNASMVLVGIEDTQKADSFLSAIYNASNYAVLPPVQIKVDHKNTITGAKIARKAKQASKRVAIEWLVKEIIKQQVNLESKLNDIISIINKE